MNALLTSCIHVAVRFRSNRLSSSSADTTRVTSAPRAGDTASVSRGTTSHNVFLRVAVAKDVGRTITQPKRPPPFLPRDLPACQLADLGDLPSRAQPQLLHLRLQALARDLQLARRLGNVAPGLVQSLLNQLALDTFSLGAD